VRDLALGVKSMGQYNLTEDLKENKDVIVSPPKHTYQIKQKWCNKKVPNKTKEKDIDNLLVVLTDLIIDLFIENRQQTKGNKTRYIKNELKDTFRIFNGRSRQVRKDLSSTRTAI
jgi:hypothetical protein